MKKIPLTKGKFALVDDADFEWLNQWKWYAQKRNNGDTAARRHGRKIIAMHRFILGITDPKIVVDHKDHNILNNQRYNIRGATISQNNANIRSHKDSTSKYLGVCLLGKKWFASAQKNRKIYRLGYFDSEIEAAKAYNDKAVELHGEFANLNRV